MKKSVVTVIMAVVMIISCIGMTACGGNQKQDSETEHTHNFVKDSFVEPTLTEQGYTIEKCSCGETRKIYTGLTGEKETVENSKHKVLFVGNSYTIYFNGVDTNFRMIAQSQGYEVETGRCAQGWYYLEKFANETVVPEGPDVPDRKTVHEELDTGNYDIVFLQEHSLYPIQDPNRFYSGARKLDAEIKEHGAKTVFYQTWGRHPDSPTLEQYHWTNQQMTYWLGASYEAIAGELNAKLSPVGSAFYMMTTEHPDVTIYHTDLTHPSTLGLYLAGLCHYATVYGKSPIGITYKPGGYTESDVQICQEIAHRAVFGGSIIPEEYKTTTEDI